MTSNVVPFTQELYAGLGQCDGLVRDEGSHLCFEYQEKDALAGIIKSDLKTRRVPLSDLVSVTLTTGWLGSHWLGAKIVIQAARMDVFVEMPGASQGRLELGISGKHYEASEKFVADLYEQEDQVDPPDDDPAA